MEGKILERIQAAELTASGRAAGPSRHRAGRMTDDLECVSV